MATDYLIKLRKCIAVKVDFAIVTASSDNSPGGNIPVTRLPFTPSTSKAVAYALYSSNGKV